MSLIPSATVVLLRPFKERFDTLTDLMAESPTRPWGEPIRPRMIKLDEGAVIIEPWDAMYASKQIHIDPKTLEASVAKVGTPFSRIWIHRGSCLPLFSG